MAVTPSLGEAISLQGRNQVAENLGDTMLKMGEAQKNRQTKLGLAQAKKGEEEQSQLYKLFNVKDDYHRLVQPKLQQTLGEVMKKVSAIQSSDSPYRSNEFTQVIADAQMKMSELKTRSDAFKTFDKQTSTIDKGKAFFGAQTEKFISEYYKNPGIKDYEQLAEKVKKDNFQFDNNLALTEDGIPLFNPEPIENYQSSIAALGKSIKPTISGSSMVSLPYDKKDIQTTFVRPFKVIDAENAYKLNPALFPQGRPIAVEDVVENYMLANPRAVDQFVSRSRLNLQRDPNTGMYSDEDFRKIKDGMMDFALPYTNPEVKDKVIGKPGQTTYDMRTSTLQSPLAPKPSRQILTFGVPGEKVDGVAVTEAQKKKNYQVNQVGVNYDLKAAGLTITPSNIIFDRYNNKLSKSLTNQTVENISTMPYKMVVVDGQKVPRIAYADEPGKVEGLMPFVRIGSAGETYFKPLQQFSYDELAGSKYDLQKLSAILDEMITRSDKATKAVQGKGYNTSKVFDVLDLYYKK